MITKVPDQRGLYTIGEAARLLQIPRERFSGWLDGYKRQGTLYPPVIRIEPTGADEVTWAEFVEGGWLREYRNTQVPLQRLRPLIDRLREEFDVAYPLWHFKPLVDPASKDLLIAAQEKLGVDEELRLIRWLPNRSGTTGQTQWAAPVERFLKKVQFNPLGIAERYRPLGEDVPVEIDPAVQFGVPQIRGFRTEAITENYAEFGDVERVAAAWGLTTGEVQAALQWEVSSRAA